VQLDLVERRRGLKQLADERTDVVEVGEDTGCVDVGLAAEELVVDASPAVVDAAGLGLGGLDKFGHDRLRRRPVLDGEGRLDREERVRACTRRHGLEAVCDCRDRVRGLCLENIAHGVAQDLLNLVFGEVVFVVEG